ncbi:hypothetical protein [Paraglaciecola sp. L3A3]|uniref:hypothetical protein n=1 Tax=Paraglaciecola sp. L3A3 TaxID=2686358 RepID=UPI00131B4291|nr:hypothetical protein [Paraglaciecola sp. L3A3]
MKQHKFFPQREELLAQLERIKDSQSFGRSDKYIALLSYLVDNTLAKITGQSDTSSASSEVMIAKSVFNKGDEYNPSDDASVRVYISNLRKKLTKYYGTEGDAETFQIMIPHGKYELIFINTAQQSAEIKTLESDDNFASNVHAGKHKLTRSPLILGLAAVSFLSILLNILIISNSGHSEVAIRSHSIWKDLNENNKKTLIVIGDAFFYQVIDNSPKKIASLVRNSFVNVTSELMLFLKEKPEINFLGIPNNKFVPSGVVVALADITPIFKSKQLYKVKMSSDLTTEEINNYNIVYIGKFTDFNQLYSFYDGSNYYLSAQTNFINKHTAKNYQLIPPFYSGYTDYGLFAKYQGTSGNSIYIISGYTDAAIMAVSQFVTNPDNFSSVNLNVGSANAADISHTNFEILFEVASFNHSHLNSKILSIDKVDTKAIWNN